MLDKFIILSQVKYSTWELKPQFVFVIFERTRNIYLLIMTSTRFFCINSRSLKIPFLVNFVLLVKKRKIANTQWKKKMPQNVHALNSLILNTWSVFALISTRSFRSTSSFQLMQLATLQLHSHKKKYISTYTQFVSFFKQNLSKLLLNQFPEQESW